MTTPTPRTLVVARPDRLGDVVLSSSCLPAVRAHLPHASIHWLIKERYRPLFHHHPLLDGLIGVGEGGLLQRIRGLREHFRSLRPDALVLLQPDRAVELAAWLERIPLRAGFSRLRCWPQFLTDRVPYRKSLGIEPEAEQNFRALARLGIGRPAGLEPVLTPDPAGRERVQQRLGARAALLPRCAAFHLAAHGGKVRAPLAAFAGLAAWLGQNHGLGVVLVGFETDPPAAQLAELAGIDPAGIIDLRGPADVAEMAWVLGTAALCAGRDSGPAHLAAALRCPTLVFFPDPRPIVGPTRWRPLGPNVEVASVNAAGQFPAADVQSAAARLLSSRGRSNCAP
jgi:ADP-heptose:LPS heptosyltransferase